MKQWHGNHRLVEKCTFLGEDFVPFIKITWTGFPIAKFNQESKKLLKVELYEVKDKETLRRLDSLEWHPNWYRRTPITTEAGKEVEIYDMFSQDFEDTSFKYRLPDNDYKYSWE